MAHPKQEIRNFYNATGKLQDSQNFYEAPCLSYIQQQLDHANIGTAVEIGVGTGRFAHRLLHNNFAEDTNYYGYDISDTMIALARKKLEGCKQNIHLERRDVCCGLPLENGSADVVFANYLFNILDENETHKLIAELYRILNPGGTIYISNICPGRTTFSTITMYMWKLIFQIWPKLVGFCKPVALENNLHHPKWEVNTKNLSSLGISSQVIMAQKAPKKA